MGVKTRIPSFLAAAAAFLTLLGGLDLSGIVSILPAPVATGFATALPLLAGIVHLIKAFGDFLDDGKINGSFKALALFLVCGISVALASCAVPDGWRVNLQTPYGDGCGIRIQAPPGRVRR